MFPMRHSRRDTEDNSMKLAHFLALFTRTQCRPQSPYVRAMLGAVIDARNG